MRSSSRRWAFVLGLGGVGFACGEEPISRHDFVGEWSYTQGTLDLRCRAVGISDPASLVDQRVWLRLGAESDLVYSDPQTGCSWTATLTEDGEASIDEGQACTFVEQGITYFGGYGPAAFTLEGGYAAFSGAMAVRASVAGSTYDCVRTTRGELERISSRAPLD